MIKMEAAAVSIAATYILYIVKPSLSNQNQFQAADYYYSKFL